MKKARQYRGGYQVSVLKNLARELRKNHTTAENLLWEILRNRNVLGFKFRRQHQFGDYVADFYCREAELVIECDGPIHDDNESWHHDQKRDAYMIAQGLQVLRFSNHQVLDDIETVMTDITKHSRATSSRAIKRRGRSRPHPDPLECEREKENKKNMIDGLLALLPLGEGLG
jgi:type I restriction enzyme R subunit